MKKRLHRGLALLITLCLLSGNLAFAEELPARSGEASTSEKTPVQKEITLPREKEVQSPETHEETVPAEEEDALEVAPEHAPEALREGAPEGVYAFSFTVVRPEYSEFGTIHKTYYNYWLTQPGSGIFDQDHGNWKLRSFQIPFDLHMAGTAQAIRQNMSYDADEYEWHTEISFENIHIPYPDVELEYYSPENEEWFDPWLLHYDLYLEKGDGKMILKVPKLKSIEQNHIPSGKNQVLQVNYNDPIKLDTLYLNGTTGKDENDGFQPTTPLKTLKKAKEIARRGIKQIVVTGETALTGDISFKDLDTTVKRAENYTGYLFYVPKNASASLSHIVIDGNADNNTNIIKSLIALKPGSTLEVKTGTVLKENYMKRGAVTLGGAIYAQDAHLKMTGGVVEGNQATYGGGIYLSNSKMDFSGGIVRKNWSERVEQTRSAGGGILATDASTINLSSKAEIRDNYAYEIGGGISLGSDQIDKTNILNMTGGIIDGNTAGACGGGIFIQAGISADKDGYKGESKAYISAGQITGNRTTGQGRSNDFFAGGGIYVNGFREEGYWLGDTEYYGANGELHLTNAIIRENTSKWEGAGIGSCPTSKTTFHINDGVAIYNNTINESGEKEGKTAAIYSAQTLGAHSGQASYKLSKRMLGGAPYHWRKFIDRDTGDIPLPEEDFRKTVLPYQEWLKLNSSDKANALTEALGTVIISGNSSATRGGGIGSNGTVIFGKAGESIDIPVEKKWDDKNDAKKIRPTSITVELIATYEDKSYVVETRELSEANGWKTVFEELPTENAGKPITYKIKEIAVAGYDSKIMWSADKGFTITNKPTTPPPTPSETYIEIPVEKKWRDDGHEMKRPTEITVTLYADGTRTNETLVLSAANEWKGVFRNLPEKKDGKVITYTVKEIEVKGYESVLTGNQSDGFVLTNTYKPEKPPTPPTPPKPPIPPIPFIRIPRAGV